MFNKALTEQKKERKRVIKEFKSSMRSRLYNGWDIGVDGPNIIDYKDAKYRITPVVKTVVDDYDKYTGSVELSHHESLGYSVVTACDSKTDTADFRFMRPQDRVRLVPQDTIQNVYLNSVNIRNSKFGGNNKIKFDISKNTDIADFAISLHQFIKNNKNIIDSINFQKIENQVQSTIIKRVCDKTEMSNITFNTLDNEEKTNVTKNI